MIGTVHYELHAFGNGTEFADDEFVADELVVVGHVRLKVLAAGGGIIIIGVFAHQNVGAGDDIFDIADAGDVLVGMNSIRIRSKHINAPYFA